MGRFISNGFKLTVLSPTAQRGMKAELSSQQLCLEGLNMAVLISTATVFRRPPMNEPLNSISVMAHLDTGASVTSIDLKLAHHLNLISAGVQQQYTAGGPVNNPVYAIDLAFPNTSLAPFSDLRICSCNLPFDLSLHKQNPSEPRNLGLLLGRDVMSRWNIVWNGPTSMVFIND